MWFGVILILCAVPLLELALLIKLGQSIGFWSTVAVIVVTAGIGIAILNAQGMAAFRRASESLAEGKPPVEPAVDGFMLMIAGGLLLAPGLLTDIAGLLLLIPPLRRLAARWGMKWIMAGGNVHVSTWQQTTTFDERHGERDFARRPRPKSGPAPVIEGEFERVDEKTAGRHPDDAPAKPYRNGHAKEP